VSNTCANHRMFGSIHRHHDLPPRVDGFLPITLSVAGRGGWSYWLRLADGRSRIIEPKRRQPQAGGSIDVVRHRGVLRPRVYRIIPWSSMAVLGGLRSHWLREPCRWGCII